MRTTVTVKTRVHSKLAPSVGPRQSSSDPTEGANLLCTRVFTVTVVRMAALHPYIVVVACALTTGVAAYYDQNTPLLQQVPGVPAPDPETASYLIPRLAHKYRPSTGDWFDVTDPRLYLLTENENDEAQGSARRLKRTGLGGGPSLSIVNPLDVLRQRLLLEIARRRMRQSEEKIQANRDFLKSIGKRSVTQQQEDESLEVAANKLVSDEASSVQPVSPPRWSSTS
uniref:Corticotropin-releasing factor domain-containing protein n=2 Tax=Graphocephala atropunctata TaxID=36148 RepID=A0A1B6MU21_9HEMI